MNLESFYSMCRTRRGRLTLVFAGGICGTLLRYFLSLVITSVMQKPYSGDGLIETFAHWFPWAIFFINLSGALILGLLYGFLEAKQSGRGGEKSPRPADLEKNQSLRLLFGTGMMGGYTTYSGFLVDSAWLVNSEQWFIGVTYLLGTLIIGLFCSYFGWMVGEKLGGNHE